MTKHVSGPLANALYELYRKMDEPEREKMRKVADDLKRQLNEQIEAETARDDKPRAMLQAQLDRISDERHSQ